MNREIKFRVWNGKSNPNGEMVYPNDINEIDPKAKIQTNYIAQRLKENMLGENSYPVMQYTGLKDKNGKEIYEGHILKIYLNEVYEDVYDEPQLALVKYSVESGFMTLEDLKQQNGGWTLNSYMAKQSEVIGDKFENKELLENETTN